MFSRRRSKGKAPAVVDPVNKKFPLRGGDSTYQEGTALMAVAHKGGRKKPQGFRSLKEGMESDGLIRPDEETRGVKSHP